MSRERFDGWTRDQIRSYVKDLEKKHEEDILRAIKERKDYLDNKINELEQRVIRSNKYYQSKIDKYEDHLNRLSNQKISESEDDGEFWEECGCHFQDGYTSIVKEARDLQKEIKG